MGRLLAQRTATSIATYTWNDTDRLLTARREPIAAGAALGVTASSVAFDYDRAGRLVAEHGAEGTVAYGFDELDNLATLALPHGQRIDLLSYGSGHVHQIRAGDRVISDVERDDLHREVLRTQGRLVRKTGYDPLGRRLWQAAGLRADALGPGQGRFWRTYRYDRLGELAAQDDNVRGRIDYQYDPAGHLLRQDRAGDVVPERFVWDAAGNLLDRAPDGSQGRVEGNRLKVWRDIRFDYDPWGNVSHKRKGTRQSQRFTFDAEDRLVAVTTGDAQGTVETRFDYDPLGRRIASSEIRRDAFGGTREERKRFVWQGLRMVQEVRDGSVSSYVYDPDSHYTPLARLDAVIGHVLAQVGIEQARETARIFHFHTDPVGTPLELTDEAGELAWAGKYTAWGKVERGEDAALLERTEQPLRYPGQYADGGTGLHYNTFRYYDPDVGRYVSQDPIGLLGGENVYSYADNPTGGADPLGWCSTTLGKNMGAKTGDGMANHHLIPEELMKDGRFAAMFQRLKSMGFNPDGAANGKFLPGSTELAKILEQPGHWSSHSNYTQAIEQRLLRLNAAFQRNALGDTQLALGIRDIQIFADNGLESGIFKIDPSTWRLL
jgi:RHS repeat-associated protein